MNFFSKSHEEKLETLEKEESNALEVATKETAKREAQT